jgi:general secretion pathway protein E
MELGVPPYLINATVLGVLAQRLVRTLCPQCKAKDESATRADLAEPWSSHGRSMAATGPTRRWAAWTAA